MAAAITPEIERLIQEARDEQYGRSLECREASPLSIYQYIPCGAPAVRFVLSERGKKVYPMCASCADHNVRHRDAQDVGEVLSTSKEIT